MDIIIYESWNAQKYNPYKCLYKGFILYVCTVIYFMDLMKTWVKLKVNFASLIPGQHRAFEKSKEYDYSYVYAIWVSEEDDDDLNWLEWLLR